MADIALAPVTTTTGLIELVLLHESPTPNFPDYDRDESLRAMRLMRGVLRNRLGHARPFGAPGATNESAIIKVRSQFGDFALAPQLPVAFMHNVYDTVAIANNPRHPRQAEFRQHVEDAVTAATELAPPADATVPNLYYWRTAGHAGPGRDTQLYTTLQGLDFYTQDNLDVLDPPAHHHRRR